MAKLTNDADYDDGEIFENVSSPLSEAGKHDNYYGRRLWTRSSGLVKLDASQEAQPTLVLQPTPTRVESSSTRSLQAKSHGKSMVTSRQASDRGAASLRSSNKSSARLPELREHLENKALMTCFRSWVSDCCRPENLPITVVESPSELLCQLQLLLEANSFLCLPEADDSPEKLQKRCNRAEAIYRY
ncbi:unnamed protein product [Protopolystoma xenopodis]|uniref:Uncharacterized protein n=1 Tax=Protopolystoma xenopodis TaxID=117903 RepID=A0A448XH36_9PLAT|nr:unnamed protein product [Protopolystoma xenopodis]